MQTIKRYKLPAHFIGWAIFFVAPVLLSPRPSDFFESGVFVPTLIRNLLLVGLFYANLYYLTPVVLKKYGIVPFLLAMAIAIIAVSFVNDWIHITYEDFGRPRGDFRPPDGFRPDEFRPGPPRGPRPMGGGPLLTSFLVTIMIASVSSSIAFWNDWNKSREIEQERALQKVASELAVLKLQISPHFLFNTLNNIRWLIRSNTQRADDAVVKLSQLLRYILYQTNDEKVPLEKELENLTDLIALQKMRLVNEDLVEFTVKGDMKGKMITPLLFVPLIENFFKHGDFDHGHPSRINLEISENRLVFVLENAVREISTAPKEDSGIGVANIVKRLALHYPNRHLLNITHNEQIYKVDLEILL